MGDCRLGRSPVLEISPGRMAMTKISLLQLSLVLGVGLTLAGCETVNDAANSVGDAASGAVAALDPTTWFGDDTPPPATADAGAPSTDATASTAPDLANLPSRPAITTAAQNQAAAQSLAADGAQARYSADALRAGTEAAAAPPAAADMPPSAQLALAAPSASDQRPTTDMAPPPSAPGCRRPPRGRRRAAAPGPEPGDRRRSRPWRGPDRRSAAAGRGRCPSTGRRTRRPRQHAGAGLRHGGQPICFRRRAGL